MVQAKVEVNLHWDHISLWLLTIASVLMYLGTRLYYLISGKSGTLSGGTVNITFSWMTIVADAALAILGIYLHQNFWKQTVQFTPFTDLAIQKMNKVRLGPVPRSRPQLRCASLSPFSIWEVFVNAMRQFSVLMGM